MAKLTRRSFLKTSVAWGSSTLLNVAARGETPPNDTPLSRGIEVLHPGMRVPASFIIDDSTCLVNMGRFCMPQFAATYPQRADYRKPWRKWPVEIPDSFVRRFGQWCAEQGVKGKYSVVPYPACVGWLDRDLPGWSQKELRESLDLVRTLMVPNWDIHPEMITHTRVIDLATGRPHATISPATMENSYPQTNVSVDQLAAYLAYALRILKNCDLPCEGITTPGGFGNLVKTALPLAVQQSVQDVYGAEIPHYFKYIAETGESTAARVEHLSGIESDSPSLTMNVYAGTGDWFGGWDGDDTPQPDRYCNRDATAGRMVELIEQNEPAVMLCHWPGMYTQGTQQGFAAFQQVVTALHQHRGDQIIWMKLSEIARYGAAKELTRAEVASDSITFRAPFACPQFTLRIPTRLQAPPSLSVMDQRVTFDRVQQPRWLAADKWLREGQSTVVCFDLPKGASTLRWPTV